MAIVLQDAATMMLLPMPQPARNVWMYLAAHGLTVADGQAAPDPGTLPQVRFWRADTCYRLPRPLVQAIHPWQQSMPLPLAPAWILVVVRIADQVVGVLDVAALHHAVRLPVVPEAVLVLVALDGIIVGLLADRLVASMEPMSNADNAGIDRAEERNRDDPAHIG